MLALKQRRIHVTFINQVEDLCRHLLYKNTKKILLEGRERSVKSKNCTFSLIKDTHTASRIVLKGSFPESKYVYCLRVFLLISAQVQISTTCTLSVTKQREQFGSGNEHYEFISLLVPELFFFNFSTLCI
jgi:hypothetical protein